jgi:hypothetical protein
MHYQQMLSLAFPFVILLLSAIVSNEIWSFFLYPKVIEYGAGAMWGRGLVRIGNLKSHANGLIININRYIK